jgi:hypothetical protein
VSVNANVSVNLSVFMTMTAAGNGFLEGSLWTAGSTASITQGNLTAMLRHTSGTCVGLRRMLTRAIEPFTRGVRAAAQQLTSSRLLRADMKVPTGSASERPMHPQMR